MLADALGLALADDIAAPIDVPPFDRSNVDGFAVRSADIAAASEAGPVQARTNRRNHRLRRHPVKAVCGRHLRP